MAVAPLQDPDSLGAAEHAPLLEVRDLAVSFDNGAGPRIQAVDGLSLTVHPGQTLAVVGESGCGKSVAAMSLLQLLPRPPSRLDRGSALFQTDTAPRDLLALDARAIRRVRGAEIAMIFQEPMTSLNPVYTVGDQILESVILHRDVPKPEARDIALEALAAVGIDEPARRMRAYPHEFSGGMRQRVMIAMALACRPKLLIADEPTTALDATIQAQILALLRDLQRARGMAVLLITHDLGVVAENADAVCVMYAGRVVEYAGVNELFERPMHPYTRGLLACIANIRQRRDRLSTIAEVIDRPGALTLTASGSPNRSDDLRPWWPWHEPPANLSPLDRPAGDYTVVEVAPQHWVGLWRTLAVRDAPDQPPSVPSKVRTIAQGA